MNTARNQDRSMIFRSHPAIDALEDRIQTNVSLISRRHQRGVLFHVDAKGFLPGCGKTIQFAVEHFILINRMAV